MRKLTQTKVHGLKKKMTDSYLIFELTAKAAGVHSPKPPVFSGAAKAAVSGGSTTSAPTSKEVTLPKKKMNSSSNSTVSSVTSGL